MTQITGGSEASAYEQISNVEAFNGTLFTNVYYYLSLHTAAPGTTGASELTSSTGHPYLRQPVMFGIATSGTVYQYNTTQVSFGQLAAHSGGYWIGLWETQVGQGYLVGSTAVVCGSITNNQALQFGLGYIRFNGTNISVPNAPLSLANPTGGTIFGTVPYGTSYFGNPSPGAAGNVLANFSAAPVTQSTILYSFINLTWNKPTNGTNLQLVRNFTSLPVDQNDGILLFNTPLSGSLTFFTDRTLTINSQGRFVYYSLFVEDSSLNWWRSADWQVILPFQYDYGAWLFSLLPQFYQELDTDNAASQDILGLPPTPNPVVATPSPGGGTPPPESGATGEFDVGEFDVAHFDDEEEE
jgi:hypothetical protein